MASKSCPSCGRRARRFGSKRLRRRATGSGSSRVGTFAACSPHCSRSRRAIAEQTYGPVVAAITRVLDAGKESGSIRQDADPGDFLQLTGALWRAASGPEDRSPRMLALILDGLRAQERP
ncbi:SbtR family transcriptional regulator [Streptomyces longwoodensis]